jgi:hypothetical protein
MDNNSVNEAIEILINNFTSHPRLSNNDTKLNVFDLLQEFWQLKENGNLKMNESKFVSQYDNEPSVSQKQIISSSNVVNILYEFLETPSPPYICFVTLPNEACFATFQVYFFSVFKTFK